MHLEKLKKIMHFAVSCTDRFCKERYNNVTKKLLLSELLIYVAIKIDTIKIKLISNKKERLYIRYVFSFIKHV